MAELIKNVEHETPFEVAGLVDYAKGEVVSLSLAQKPGCKMTVFAIDEGEGMSTHAAPGDAMAFVLEGTAQIVINDVPHEIHAGQAIVMPKDAPHSVKGLTPFKMLLVVVK